MARNQHAGPSTLRNRNRVTNKTRLKVIKESIDADPIVLDEDEEKARVVSTAGVDAEDANEHHLQAVLSAAAATRHHSFTRSTRGAEKEPAHTAYIPTPDSTGVVDNYEELYPPNKWRDPVTYVKSSDSVEEATEFALANGFIYYMDERDKEWLDKNNEDRGEGSSKRPSRKGKEPESVPISEDEFELVMAIFEKITHEKAEFLHHNFQDVPPFSLYEETFASPLPPTTFAIFRVPSWIPAPAQLLRVARVIYPHWSARKTGRNGNPIIPVVNLDESDTKNESYICFRRRESKAVRKTRAQQATYSDKMIRLQSELSTAMSLANEVLSREKIKQQAALEGKGLWQKRFVLVDMKRKFPTLGTKEDEELFQDRERVPKKIKTDISGRLPLKLRTPRDSGDYGTPMAVEPMMKPKDRTAMIQAQIEEEMLKRKDHRWEDVADNPYQQFPQPFASRHFKYVSPSRAAGADTVNGPERNRACRLRYGRGGRRHLDRRLPGMRHVLPHSSDSDPEDNSDLERRWRFDADDEPVIGPDGPDEHDRVLIDDFDSQYLLHSASLINEEDLMILAPDATITVTGPDGRLQQLVGVSRMPHMLARQQRAVPNAQMSRGPTPQATVNGVNANMHQQRAMAPMAPPPAVPQARVPSNGIMRPPSTPAMPALPATPAPVSTPTPPQPSPLSVASGSGIDLNHGEQEAKLVAPATPSPASQILPEVPQSEMPTVPAPSTSPVRPKVPTPTMTAIPNGFTIPAVNSYPNHMPNGASYAVRTNSYNPQVLKSAFASFAQAGDVNGTHHPMRAPANSYITPSGAYTAQLAAARQMHWLASQQRAPNVNIVDASGMDASLTNGLSPPLSTPQRVPSANGSRSIPISRGVSSPALAQAMAAGQGRSSPANTHAARLPQHSPTLLSPGLVGAQAQQSPPRPQSHIPSPSMQARQIVGSSGF